MHPTLMTMIADDRAQGLRSAAESRRGRVVRTGQPPVLRVPPPAPQRAGGARVARVTMPG